MKNAAIAALTASLVACVMSGPADDRANRDQPLQIRDSEGRIRIASEERGEEFGLVMYGGNGKRRLMLSCDDDGSSIMVDAGDGRAIVIKDSKGQMSISLASPSRVLAARSIDDMSGVFIEDGEGGSLVELAAKRDATRLSLRDPLNAEDYVSVLSSRGPLGRGLVIGDEERLRAGVVANRDGGLAWVGEMSTSPVTRGRGIFSLYSSRTGATQELRGHWNGAGMVGISNENTATWNAIVPSRGSTLLGVTGAGPVVDVKDGELLSVWSLPTK